MTRKAATNMTMPSALEISRQATLKPVTEIAAEAGAGFVYPLCGDMRTMPGLTTHPAAEHIDIDADGKVVGLA
jgi:formyltetrahydrofolate synthetase